MATSPPPAENSPLNGEHAERQVSKLDMGNSAEDQSAVDELKEKLKKPTIGVSLFVFLILNVVMFIVGVTTTKDCPIQPIIPIYLAVGGAFGIITKVIPIINRNRRIAVLDHIVSALFIIEFIWMILGSYWIYSIYKPNYIPGPELYCNKTAYLLAFWLLTIHYVCLLILLTLPCFILCCFCCMAAITDRNN